MGGLTLFGLITTCSDTLHCGWNVTLVYLTAVEAEDQRAWRYRIPGRSECDVLADLGGINYVRSVELVSA